MSAHGPDHEVLLEALWTQGLDADSKEMRALLARCETCRQTYTDLRAVEQRIQGAARFESDVASEVAAAAPAPGEEAIEGLLEELARQGPAAKRPRSMRKRELWAWLSGLAALLASVLYLALNSRDPEAPTYLGGRLEAVHPNRLVDRFAPFEWRDPDGASRVYEVEVWTIDAQGRRVELVTPSARVRVTTWIPDPELMTRWTPLLNNRTLQWKVTGYSASGDVTNASDVFSATLRAP